MDDDVGYCVTQYNDIDF